MVKILLQLFEVLPLADILNIGIRIIIFLLS